MREELRVILNKLSLIPELTWFSNELLMRIFTQEFVATVSAGIAAPHTPAYPPSAASASASGHKRKRVEFDATATDKPEQAHLSSFGRR